MQLCRHSYVRKQFELNALIIITDPEPLIISSGEVILSVLNCDSNN